MVGEPTVLVAVRAGAQAAVHESLAAAGFAVELAEGAAEALAAVRRAPPDVCVVDRGVPGVGVSAIAALTTAPRRPRVVVVGETGGPAAERAATLAGAAQCLRGPVEPARVATAVSDLIRSQRTQ